MKKLLLSCSILALMMSYAYADNSPIPASPHAKRVIMFVWDGLRPDSISEQNTPNLYALSQSGVYFSDNHSSYPTFTMMNAASFATGDFAGKTGFYGNELWEFQAKGINSAGKPVDFEQPVFTEDYEILKDLNRSQAQDPLLEVGTLFQAVHQAGFTTAAVGKSGPAFMQDYLEAGDKSIILDERHVYPLSFAKKLMSAGYSLPAPSAIDYPKGSLILASNNGDPTEPSSVITLDSLSSQALGSSSNFNYPDHVTSNPAATDVSPYSKANEYMMQVYLAQILPSNPKLSVVWMRNPDTTEHNYGPGSASYVSALADQDQLLGELEQALKQLGMDKDTDLIIVSDHGHSSVSGPLNEFPLRAIENNQVAHIEPNGYSASGDVRTADLLSRAGFKHVYDGAGCEYDPVMSGILANAAPLYPVNNDSSGKICGGAVILRDVNGHRTQNVGSLYTTPSYKVPAKLPANSIVIAANGGSDYLYVPSHNANLVKRLVRFFQGREEYGAVFVDSRYGSVPGTLPLQLVHLENKRGKNPDIIVGMNFDENAVVQGMKGIEFNTGGIDRGMHGSFSPIDVHNTLIAYGPDFKNKFTDTLPSGNVDVAPTIAYLLGVKLPNTDGRPLYEATANGPAISAYSVSKMTYSPAKAATGLKVYPAIDPNEHNPASGLSNYTIDLQTKNLSFAGQHYTYFDYAKALRQ